MERLNQNQKNADLILNPYFLIGLILLILNDSFFKWHYGNFVTGKLSDFAGLFIFPIFIAFVFPKSKRFVSLVVAVLFILWKSPFCTPILELVNSISLLQFYRTIDYSDLLALVMLPISHHFINNEGYLKVKLYPTLNFVRVLILIIASTAFMATSMPRYEIPKGTVYLGKSYKVKMSKDDFLDKVNSLGYECSLKYDTLSRPYSNYSKGYYQIDSVIIRNDGTPIDTLKNIKFNLVELKKDKIKIELINVEFMKPGNIQDWKNLRSHSRFYKRMLKEHFLDTVD